MVTSRVASRRSGQWWIWDYFVVALVILLIFASFYGENIRSGAPISYDGDSISVMARIKGYAQGETPLLFPQYVSRLNAPFSASWSDFPSEKFTYYIPGVLARYLGLAAVTTIWVFSLQLAAGISFLAATRLLGFDRIVSMVGAILFGLAPYAFQRNLNHLNLIIYAYLPLLVVMVTWLWERNEILRHRWGVLVLLSISSVAGLFNPYYLIWYLGFLLLLMIANIVQRDWGYATLAFAGIAAGALVFAIQNLDTFIFHWQYGPNPGAVTRNLWGLIQFGLTLPDLFFPNAHQWSWLENLSRNLYLTHVPTAMQGESQTSYIGIVAATALIWLLLEGVLAIASQKPEKVSSYFWMSTGILAFGLIGGVNYLFGSFGFMLLRGTNRLSILLTAIALLYLCGKLSLGWGKRWRFSLILVILIIGIWDQLPTWPWWIRQTHQAATTAWYQDQKLFPQMELALPAGAMVFQLPVKSYPETGALLEMGDYEHFRPYLHTDGLRFSYGTIKGRGDADWQLPISTMPPHEMIEKLQSLGFSALLINRKGYPDHAMNLVGQMQSAGYTPWKNEGDFIIYLLKPNLAPALPVPEKNFQITYSGDFYPEEISEGKSMRWCGRAGAMKIIPTFRISENKHQIPVQSRHLIFGIEPASPKVHVKISIDKQTKKIIATSVGTIEEVEIDIPSSGCELSFHADGPGVNWEGDPRHDIRFRVINPTLVKPR
jgi:hypothetical protein